MLGKFIAAMAPGLVLLALPSHAATFTYEISRLVPGEASPFEASFSIDSDFLSDVVNSTEGLTVNSMNFPADGGVVYSYFAGTDFLSIDGSLHNFSPTGNDFTFSVSNATTSPSLFGFGIRLEGGIDTGIAAEGDFNSYSGTPSAVVPLPVSLPLLGTAIGVFGIIRLPRRRTG